MTEEFLPKIYGGYNDSMYLKIDLTKDIPLLVKYIQEYEKGLNKTYESDKSDSRYNYYFEQFGNLSKLRPNFEYRNLLERKYSDLLSYFYSGDYLMLTGRIKSRYQSKIRF